MAGPRNRTIERTMEQIQSLLTNGDNLKEKYSLKVHRAPVGSKLIEGPSLSAFAKAFQTTKTFWNTSLQRKSQISGTIRWAVGDRDKFDKLIQNLRDLLADLTKFTDEIGVGDSQRLIVEYELEMIDDEPSLEAIAAASACNDDDDLVSRAASRRLSRVKAQSAGNQSVNFDDSVSMASAVRYTPSISTIVEEDMDGIAQEIGITRVPISEWRKFKTRAGIMPWLKVLVVAMDTPSTSLDAQEDMQPLSRSNTGFVGPEKASDGRAARIAINSRILIGILKKVSGVRLSTEQNVLVYPFKPLIAYEAELRRYLRNTQKKLSGLIEAKGVEPAHQSESRETGSSGGHQVDDSTSREIEVTRRSTEELECLIAFMDTDMRSLFDVRRDVKEHKLTEIAFEHLWLLFQPGTITLSDDSTDEANRRAYQVLHVTGGRPIVDVENRSKSERLEISDSWEGDDLDGFAVVSSRKCTDLIVDCFYIDFHATAYGPRGQRFTIAEFGGLRQLSSLPLYPLPEAEIGNLVSRGKKFRHCMMIKQYHYHGQALKEWDADHRPGNNAQTQVSTLLAPCYPANRGFKDFWNRHH